ncbi:efflux RND transporter periplasmic adaptor subunit [Thermoactinomyces mirandus]|uniref:Efflux RND transporter periplasmic adaptor subunit n=1 Tax=Thermoactinomyces mirandus TaxID=2756294 RepID=A0A7W1XRP6_9BACL|nr:efflux RND transporter periplasmic adaptor subunit [Thermoactinomyces mirandus]MBA4602024.1 efflux RND transporter periplasmic adaptor subunit [Thermoactinomyces mirandus]
MKTGRLILINALVFLIIVGLGIGGYYYYYMQSNFIRTEDAKVKGDIVSISSLGNGMLEDWQAEEGQEVRKGQVLGRINTGQQMLDIASPIDGTIIKSEFSTGQMAAAGQTLAQVANLGNLYIEANIEETVIKDVSVGQEVDITVDAEGNTKIKGTVAKIGKATNSTFSLLPQQPASGDYNRVTQHIPVMIEMKSYPDTILPGMNATVRIHK